MAVLLKPNGLFGAAYMAAIKPFRYVIVYPALMRQIGREWRAGAGNRAYKKTRHGAHIARFVTDVVVLNRPVVLSAEVR
jgi:hypothetical protein